MRVSTIICFLISVLVYFSTPYASYANSSGARVFNHPVSIRSYGMGNTGTADYADPANAFFNPANLAEHRGVHLRSAYGKLLPSFYDDVRLMSFGASGGHQSSLDNSRVWSLGVDLRHVRMEYGAHFATDAFGNVRDSFNSVENYTGISIGGGMFFSGIYHLGLGVSCKYFRANFAPAYVTQEGLAGTTWALSFDGGIRFAARLLEESGYLLVPAVGLSYLNLGRDISFIDQEQADEQPRTLRVGLGLRFESPSNLEIDKMLDTEVPIVTLSVNLDLADSRATSKSHVYGAGLEASLLQAGFFRIGYIHDKDSNTKGLTYGLGLGLRINMFQGRFDYAWVPQAKNLDYSGKYGVSVGVYF